MAQISTEYTDKVTTTTSSSSINRTATDSLDKMAFLELLVAEMANQDPLDPMDDTDFIAQLAQFSTLEEMENMNTSTMKSQGIDLIGKTVTASLSSTTESYVTGTVDSVIYNSGDVYLDIEGNVVSLDNIKEILETTSANNDSEE